MSLHRPSCPDPAPGFAPACGSRSRVPAPRWRGVLGRVAMLAAPLVLAACAAGVAQVNEMPLTLFDDAHFAPPSEPINPDDVFKLTPEMRAYMNDEIRPFAGADGVRQALTKALYTRSKLQLDYEATMTRNAAQAFEARSGNCLSLVIMTGAFAQALGLDVTYQQVVTDEMWSRAGGMYFQSGHVNLQLERHFTDKVTTFDRVGTYTIDFMPSEDSVGLHAHAIDQETVLAMYMNNRAAEAMLGGQLDDAYWRVRQAVALDPSFLSSYNTLGVIYLRHGDPARAALALKFSLDHVPNDAPVVANYAQALHRLGRDDEAKAYEIRLAELEPYPPFHFFNLGQAAFKAGDMHAARAFFKKELERDPDYHEFHYWLAITDFSLGEVDEARRELAVALADSVKRSDRDLYAAKLDRLRSYRQQSAVQ